MDNTNAIIGDQTGVDLPQAPVDESALIELRKKAKFSKSREFRELREKMTERIDFYSKFLPDGRGLDVVSTKEAAENWRIATIVISELTAVMDAYDGSIELLKDADG